MNILCLLQPYS